MNLRGRNSLTAYQQDTWAANSPFPDLPQSNCFITDRFTGEVDVELLKECLRRAADRNAAFQLRIDPEDGTPCQWAEHEAFDAPFEVARRRLFEIAVPHNARTSSTPRSRCITSSPTPGG